MFDPNSDSVFQDVPDEPPLQSQDQELVDDMSSILACVSDLRELLSHYPQSRMSLTIEPDAEVRVSLNLTWPNPSGRPMTTIEMSVDKTVPL